MFHVKALGNAPVFPHFQKGMLRGPASHATRSERTVLEQVSHALTSCISVPPNAWILFLTRFVVFRQAHHPNFSRKASLLTFFSMLALHLGQSFCFVPSSVQVYHVLRKGIPHTSQSPGWVKIPMMTGRIMITSRKMIHPIVYHPLMYVIVLPRIFHSLSTSRQFISLQLYATQILAIIVQGSCFRETFVIFLMILTA